MSSLSRHLKLPVLCFKVVAGMVRVYISLFCAYRVSAYHNVDCGPSNQAGSLRSDV